MKVSIKTYAALMRLPTFMDRYRYLKLEGRVGERTFGNDRYLNQLLYHHPRWRRVRDDVIIRDNGCDLADPDREIFSRIIVHHMNAITIEDIEFDRPILYDMNGLITSSHNTHEAIHYGDEDLLFSLPAERRPNDTIPWRTSSRL